MGALNKATFRRCYPNGQMYGIELPVLYNPTEYTINKAVHFAEIAIPGLDSPLLQFVNGQAETLSLDLFFDTTDQGMGVNATPVTTETDKFYQLLKIEKSTHAPPICYFWWGDKGFPGGYIDADQANQNRTGFKCVVESVRQVFTLFSPQGIPLRAKLSVSLKEYKTIADQIDQINRNSADHTKAHVVQQGETLSGIADANYNDPAAWRSVAQFNGITDPLAIRPGMILQLPPTQK